LSSGFGQNTRVKHKRRRNRNRNRNTLKEISNSKYLAESVSQSGAGDASSDNYDVNFAFALRRSAFSGGSGDVFGAQSGIGLRRCATFLPCENEIANHKYAQRGAYDPSKHVRVQHFEEPHAHGDDGAVFSL